MNHVTFETPQGRRFKVRNSIGVLLADHITRVAFASVSREFRLA
jgi:hypothetical protein